MKEGTDYKTPEEALAAAVEHVTDVVTTMRLAEVTFGQRAVDGRGYYWVARYSTEVTNGTERPARQSNSDRIAMVTQAFGRFFVVVRQPQEG